MCTPGLVAIKDSGEGIFAKELKARLERWCMISERFQRCCLSRLSSLCNALE